MKKCQYCGKAITNESDFCCEQCRNNYQKVIRKDEPRIKLFAAGIIICFLLIFYGIFKDSDYIIGGGIVLMGIVITSLPFTTPETNTLLGYQKAKILGRILGIIVITVGIWVGIINLKTVCGLLVYKEGGNYVKHQKELLTIAAPDEQTIINTFLSLKMGGKVDFIPMSETLFGWSKKWISENS